MSIVVFPRATATLLTAVVAVATVTATAGSAAAHPKEQTYTVRRGDTLSAIAARTGTSTGTLARANGIGDRNHVVAGRVLIVPRSSRSSTPGATRGTARHRVAPGEHLTGIAQRYGVSVRALAETNGVRDRDHVVVGRVLDVPAGGKPSTGSTGAVGPTRARAHIGELLERTAREYGWRPDIVKALAWQESGWNNATVSSAGAVGVMQVLPSTGRFVSRHLVGRPLDLQDPKDNVRAGVAFLDYLYGLTDGDVRLTLAGYYQGLQSVRRRGVAPDTDRYIDNVLALRRRFR